MNKRNIPPPPHNAKQTSDTNSISAKQPGVVQRQTATSPAVQRTQTPPPVYRPQPVPRVLQRKSALPSDKSLSSRLAPPPPDGRAEAKMIVPPKTAGRSNSPSVFNPNPTPKVLQLKSNRTASEPHKPAAHPNPVRIARPDAAIRQRTTPVIQRADSGGRSSANVNTYSSLGQHYTAEQIQEAQQEALGKNVHGHRSGGTGSGVSNQTQTEMAKVVEVLHKKKAAAHKAKKAVSHDRAPMSGYAKAEKKAESILAEQGKDGLGDFVTYLDTREAELGLTEQEVDELIKMFT
jgi:hypothetical protein